MEWKGKNVVLTGASRGLGAVIARTLAGKGAHLVLAARSAGPLQELASEVEKLGVRALAVPTDVGDTASLHALVAAAEGFGPVDVLINNAGLEEISSFETLPLDTIEQIMRVNLVAPMLLTRLLLPGMLTRGRGHIVNIGSIAGLGPAAFGEPYGASKHGLVGFTKALRASLQTSGAPVSASVVCPGFVSDLGMYEVMRRDFGATASLFMGTSPPQAVADAVVRCVERDLSDVIVNPLPMRLNLALFAMFPRVMEKLFLKLGVHETFRVTAANRAKKLAEAGS